MTTNELPTATDLSERLKAWRAHTSQTQVQASIRLRANLSTYRNWEAGRRQPQGGYRAFVLEVLDREGGGK